MKLLKLVPDTPKIDFTGKRIMAFILSAMLIAASLGIFFTKGLNLGIDFLGGIQIEVQTDGPADLAAIRSDMSSLSLGDVSVQEFGEADTVLIRVQRQEGDEKAQQVAIDKVKAKLNPVVIEYRRTESVGPTVGAELQEAALWAVLSAVGAILIYIWFRFEWQFGVAAVIALTHDVITTIGLFSILQLDFNLATIAALLTIAGYSINDTVVVFDRVRENMRKYKKMELAELFNLSVNQTLSRTIMTSITTMLALLALGIWGGEVLRGFSIALIWGVLIGTYSSIALAVPVLLYMNPDRGEEEELEEGEASGEKA